ncbi:hypothetical protein GCM10022240_28050 [Microbacterium kribbense]|uniref:ABC transporter n=1 Tax=Microbacterium kribbense TaxID=433645 RepID=A0ABP7GUD4_9MICO
MSDPQAPMGEPTDDEQRSVDDVVGQAHEGLAEAEAAGRGAVDDPAQNSSDADASAEQQSAEHSDDAPAEPAAADAAPAAEPAGPTYAAPVAETYAAPATETYAAPATEAYTPPAAETDYAPTAGGPAAAAATAETGYASAAQQPIFVQAPEEPRPRGNRAAAAGIGVIAAICFGILYLAAGVVIGLVNGDITSAGIGGWLVGALGTWGLWVPTVVFFIAFWLLGAIVNRGRWAGWVIFGLLVGLAAYGGHLLGQLFEAPFWLVSAEEGRHIVDGQLFAPLAIAAFVIGRELTIWFGAWAAARGRRMSELNVAARREYERTLEAGPQLAR